MDVPTDMMNTIYTQLVKLGYNKLEIKESY
jgi:hypothetical protein